MSNIGFCRPNCTEPLFVGAFTKRFDKCSQFGGITQGRTGSMRFNVTNTFSLYAGIGQSLHDNSCLAPDTRCGVTNLQRTIIIDG